MAMHHQRRKSGHTSANTSMTDVRKAVTLSELSAKYNSRASRPEPTRRTTDKSVTKLGKSSRDREREWEDERWFQDERESFPQFWYVKLSPLLVSISLHIAFVGSCGEDFPTKLGLCEQYLSSPSRTPSWVSCSVLPQRRLLQVLGALVTTRGVPSGASVMNN